MFTWMRTHQRKLMLVITILTIVAFAFLYDYTDRNKGRDTMHVAQIYGRSLSVDDFRREMRKYDLALGLGLADYANMLGSHGAESDLTYFVLNKMVIDHQGRALGIDPDRPEIVQAIAALPVFQTGGQFDIKKYNEVLATSLGPRGFTEREIEEIVRSSIIFHRIKDMIETAPAVSPAEVAYLSRMFQPVTGTTIMFELADFSKQVKVTEPEIEAAFKAGAAHFVTPELRTVRYVRFPMPTDLQKLEGKAKVSAEEKVAKAAQSFFDTATTAGFENAAKQANLKIETTLPFDANGGLPSLKELGNTGNVNVSGPISVIAPAAFVLTREKPISRALEGDNEFIVAELGEITPSRPMTLAEARPEITTQLTNTAAKAAIDKAAAAALAKLRDAAKAGQPAAQAAAAAGLKTKPFTKVSIADETAAMDQRRYAQAALIVNEGEITGFQPDDDGGGFLVWLEKRAPVDPKSVDLHQNELIAGIAGLRKRVLWMDWLSSAQKDAGIGFAGAPRG